MLVPGPDLTSACNLPVVAFDALVVENRPYLGRGAQGVDPRGSSERHSRESPVELARVYGVVREAVQGQHVAVRGVHELLTLLEAELLVLVNANLRPDLADGSHLRPLPVQPS
jgi:hypothetical protein